MGFCRRCGDIVVGARCKCGGSSVAPVVKWNHGGEDEKQDRWSRTYVTKERSSTQPDSRPESSTNAPLRSTYTGSTAPVKRFPRPQSSMQPTQAALGSRVSAHIASATAYRPPSPLKHSTSASEDSNAEEGILPNLHSGSELAKVYGSVLQPKETLTSFSCTICASPFPPDATIYPDPLSLNSFGVETDETGMRFLCRPCFTANGGSKGDCPACHRAVLILKSEGGFVEAAGKVWHKKCFCCDGCLKNIGDCPMVDLLGRPSCAECFDTCLKRPTRDSLDSPSNGSKRSTLGGVKRGNQSREGSPALEELEQRLGIIRSREGTPAAEEPISKPNKSMSSPMSKGSPHTPLSNRYTPRNDVSPTVERLAGRTRANSSASAGPSTHILNRYRSPEPDSDTATDDGSPRYSYARLKSPELHPDGSPVGRRTYNRFKSPEPEYTNRSPASKYTSSPPHSSPASKQPTGEAIEEMKRRFLKHASPSPSSVTASTSSSATPTPTRRSRSRPRASDASTIVPNGSPRSNDVVTPQKDRELQSRLPVAIRASASPRLCTSPSTSSLRSDFRPQSTGTTEFSLRTDRTGESTIPLVLRDRTGNSEYPLRRDITGQTEYLMQQRTGSTYLSRDNTGDTGRIRRQRTGETEFSIRTRRTGESNHAIRRQRTGETDYSVRVHRTGDSSLGIRRQQTGETVLPRQITGESVVLRPQRTGDTEVRTLRTGETDYTLRRDRTGDAEVESLLGTFPTIETADLIDLSSSESAGSMSKIPLSTSRSSIGASELGLGLRTIKSNSSLRTDYDQSVPPTPDLAGDFSDTMSTQSSGPSTPPSISPPSRRSRNSLTKRGNGSVATHYTGGKDSSHRSSDINNVTPTPKSKKMPGGITIPTPLPADTRCAKCNLPLFSNKDGGKFVTVPEEPTSSGIPPKTYHTSCFKCNVCGEVFEEREGGHAVFVRGEEGACHVRCAPPEKITLRKIPTTVMPPKTPRFTSSSTSSIPTSTTTAYYTSSSRYERPPPTAPATTTSFTFPQPRFGGSGSCPGCNLSVSPMERGVVPGPQGTRWHATCLICGGKEAKGRRKEEGKPGCGKKLDSAAKTDAEGRVWCRECLLLLPPALRQPSPVRSPIVPSATGGRGPFVAPQHTGTTIARQFTGLGGSDAALMRQLTGGGLSPTRQLSSSPTKLHDGPRRGARYPRPKSVTGIRSTNGEGRGMFLVRQLTGGSGSFSGNDYGL